MAIPITPGVKVTEKPAGVTRINPVPASIPTFFGVTERGPVDEATIVLSFSDFEAQFGGAVVGFEQLWLQVRAFFQNAGEGAPFVYVIRAVHHTIQGDPSTAQATTGTLTLQTSPGSATAAQNGSTNAEPFTGISAGDGFVFQDVDSTGPQTATFAATFGNLVSGAAETYVLADGNTLTLESDTFLLKSITFTTGAFPAIGSATAAEVAAAINGQINDGFNYAVDNAGTLEIRSKTEGTNAFIHVTGGTANGVLLLSTTPNLGTGVVADISSVTAAEIKTVVENDITTDPVTVDILVGGFVRFNSTTTGPGSTLQINAGPVQISLGVSIVLIAGTTGVPVDTLKFDGRTPYDNSNTQIRIVIPSSSGDTGRFDLFVVEDGIERESFRDVIMDVNDARYVVTAMNASIGANGSQRVLATDLFVLASDTRPVAGLSAVFLGGGDGLGGLVDDDFFGAVAAGGTKTGFRLIDALLDTDEAPQIGPLVPGRGSSAMWNAQRTYAEFTTFGAMATIPDVPSTVSTTREMKTSVMGAGLLGASEFVVFYYSRLEVLNPNRAVFGEVARVEMGVAGAVAGVWARRDGIDEFGVGKAPSGLNNTGLLRGVVGVTDKKLTDPAERAILGHANVNVIRPTRVPQSVTDQQQIYVADTITSRSVDQGALFPQVQQRRLVIFAEQSLKRAAEKVLMSDNTASVRRSFKSQNDKFLQGMVDAGVMERFTSDIGPSVNTDASIEDGIFRIKDTLKPTSAIREIEIVVQPFGAGA